MGEQVFLREMLDIPPRRRLTLERERLLDVIDRQEGHLEAGTRSPDPTPPLEILTWAQERLAVIDGRLRGLVD